MARATEAADPEAAAVERVPMRVHFIQSADWAGGTTIAVGPDAPWKVQLTANGMWIESKTDDVIVWMPHSAIRYVRFRRA